MRPRVSDHAVLRFLERKYGFDLDRVRAEMMTPIVEAAIIAGATQVSVHGGRLVVKQGVITSFLPGTSRKRQRNNVRTWGGD